MLRKIPLYPFLFALFPIFTLTAHNVREISVGEAGRPLVFSVLVAALVFGLANLLLRSRHRAGLAAALIIFLFFSYGQVYGAWEGRTIAGVELFRHRALVPVFLAVGLASTLWIARIKQPDAPMYFLNLLSMFLLVTPLFNVSAALVQQFIADSSAKSAGSIVNGAESTGRPDVYYIIVDGYGRSDILQREFGFDDRAFVEGLRARGFYVADCSQSNYAHTLYSLSSSLNYDYLDALGADSDPERVALLKHGAVRAAFESRGYDIVAFPTGWSMTEWTDADIYTDYGGSFTTLTEFETLFLDTTLVRVWTDYERGTSKATPYSAARRLRVLSMIETLKSLPAREGDHFVFAHFVIPHPPFSFGADGETLEINVDTASRAEISEAYVSQSIYIGREILGVVDSLLAESESPPVILIQGDHGPPPDLTNDPAVRMPILNAYYLPGVDMTRVLYPSISPVNSFRVVLDEYFDLDLPLLEDKSYFAPNQDHERLRLVENSCP